MQNNQSATPFVASTPALQAQYKLALSRKQEEEARIVATASTLRSMFGATEVPALLIKSIYPLLEREFMWVEENDRVLCEERQRSILSEVYSTVEAAVQLLELFQATETLRVFENRIDTIKKGGTPE